MDLASKGSMDVMVSGNRYEVAFMPCNDTVTLETAPGHISITLQHSGCQCGLGAHSGPVPLVTWQLTSTKQLNYISHGFFPGPNTRALMAHVGDIAFSMLRAACSAMQPGLETGEVMVSRSWIWSVVS